MESQLHCISKVYWTLKETDCVHLEQKVDTLHIYSTNRMPPQVDRAQILSSNLQITKEFRPTSPRQFLAEWAVFRIAVLLAETVCHQGLHQTNS
ncbi:MAG TPA: hypothetical protein DCX14_06150 [Flavobacteriales bacterium]|nr:hypothetical protein [Flavobacteriales bacterium]